MTKTPRLYPFLQALQHLTVRFHPFATCAPIRHRLLCDTQLPFAVTFAAIEAFMALGGHDVQDAIEDLKVDFQAIAAANKKDDDVDDDSNGVKVHHLLSIYFSL